MDISRWLIYTCNFYLFDLALFVTMAKKQKQKQKQKAGSPIKDLGDDGLKV